MHGLQPLDDAARQVIAGYAARGVFRSWTETQAASGPIFRFHWLWNAPFTLKLHRRSGTIVFPGLLPAFLPVAPEVREFLVDCASTGRPAHRRLDPRSLTVTCSSRSGAASLRFKIRGGDPAQGVKGAIAVVNELLVHHLASRHPSYLAEHFHVAEE